jgi:hypothetical protein
MKTVVYALLAIMMIATALGDSGTSLWKGTWKSNYAGTPVNLVIKDNLNGDVCPMTGGCVATLGNGKVSDDGTTYTAKWTAEVTQPGEGDTATLVIKRTEPTKFTGKITWPDGFWLPFNGELDENS